MRRVVAAVPSLALLAGTTEALAQDYRVDRHYLDTPMYHEGSTRVWGGTFLFFMHNITLVLGGFAGAEAARSNLTGDYAIAAGLEGLAIAAFVIGVVELVRGIRLRHAARRSDRRVGLLEY